MPPVRGGVRDALWATQRSLCWVGVRPSAVTGVDEADRLSDRQVAVTTGYHRPVSVTLVYLSVHLRVFVQSVIGSLR